MVLNIFGKKKKPEELPPMGEEPMEEPGIREQVGYPPEGGYEEVPPEEGPFEPGAEPLPEEYPPEEAPFEGAEPPPGEAPEFLPEASAPAGGAYTAEDIERVAHEVADEGRKEFDEKIKSLTDEVEELRRLDQEIEKMSGTFEKLSEKYQELEDKMEELPTQTQEDLKEIKATVNSINQIMSSALPALIKEVREL